MRKDNTLFELKQKVSGMVNISPNEFVLKRYHMQREFKNMNSKLSELGLTNGGLIKIEKGKPHQDGFYEVNIHQVTLRGHKSPLKECGIDEGFDDSVIFNKKFLFKISIAPDASALEFKHKILEKYNELLL